MILRLVALPLAAVAFTVGGCSGAGPEDSGPRQLPDDPNKPYVVTAIDYHFHDAHPSRLLSPRREVIISNQGSNVHNVTFEGTNYARDIQPGERLSLGPIGRLFDEPGPQRFACKYHLDREMRGVLLVEES
jgi:hypothetical protein